MKDEKWLKILQKYEDFYKENEQVFLNLQEDCPFLSYSDIALDQVTREEKDQLAQIDITNKGSVLNGVNSILERFKKIKIINISESEAESKLCKIKNEIPVGDTEDIHLFHIFCEKEAWVSEEELKWMYENKLIPHLFMVRGKPKFHRSMWFIVDLAIRQAKRYGSVFIDRFKPTYETQQDWKPYLDIIRILYYSNLISEAKEKYANRLAWLDKKKEENIDFDLFLKMHSDQIEKNEVKVLYKKIIRLYKPKIENLKTFRDAFGLLAYASWPTLIIEHLSKTKSWKDISDALNQYLKLFVTDPIRVDTFWPKCTAEKYLSFYNHTEKVLSLMQDRSFCSWEDLIAIYLEKEYQQNIFDKIPCPICNNLFTPQKKTDVTCGSVFCILKNKNRRKKANLKAKAGIL